jgi:cytochrome c oxidase cbb3-type subunit I/II
MIPESIMPPYQWLIKRDLDISTTPRKIRAMQWLGVPYPEGYDQIANDELMNQATEIANDLRNSGIEVEPTKEVIALIAYIQRLGLDIYRANMAASN